MPRARWTPQARRDLKELAKYIAHQGQRPMAADRLVDRINRKVDEYVWTKTRIESGSCG
jgi:plasmid stabilization system protein ParE